MSQVTKHLARCIVTEIIAIEKNPLSLCQRNFNRFKRLEIETNVVNEKAKSYSIILGFAS